MLTNDIIKKELHYRKPIKTHIHLYSTFEIPKMNTKLQKLSKSDIALNVESRGKKRKRMMLGRIESSYSVQDTMKV